MIYIKIKLIYEDSTEEIIPVTEDMIDEKDLAKLTKAGSPRITINYKDEFQLTYVVKLIDSADLDKNLNKDGKYNAVVKAIRSNDRINFYIEPKDAVAALSFAYTFDSSIMQVSDALTVVEADGGATYRHFLSSRREALDIQLSAGCNAIFCRSYFVYVVVKLYVLKWVKSLYYKIKS